jgi:hypothetical protein
LRRLPFLSLPQHRIAFCDWFLRSFYSGALQSSILYEAVDRVFTLDENPCLADLRNVVKGMYKKTDTYSRRDGIDGIVGRLDRTEQILGNVFYTREGVRREDMRGVYFGATTYTDVAEWLFSYYIVYNAFLINRHAQRRNQFTHLILLDESVFSLSTAQAANRITGINPLAVLLTQLREFSLQMLVTAVTWEGTDPLVVRNCATIGILPGLLDARRAGTPRWATKGGGAQHAYLLQEYQHFIAAARKEITIGADDARKSVDLLIRYHDDDHVVFWELLSRATRAPLPDLPNGALIALEAEVSDPRTGPNNATKNYAAGIRLTIIATMPRIMKPTTAGIAKLPRHIQAATVVIDALGLLDQLRAASEEQA